MKLIQNIYYRISSNVIIAALSFIASVVVIRTFGAEIVGTIAYYMSIFSVITCICDLGLSNAFIKFTADEKIEENALIFAYLSLKTILVATYFLLGASVIVYFDDVDQKLMLIFFVTFFIRSAFKEPFFKMRMAKRDFKTISLVELISNSIIFIYTITVCLFFQNIYLLSLKLLLIYIIEILVISIIIFREKKLIFKFPDWQVIKKYINFSLPFALTTFISSLVANIDKLIIGNMIGMKELGFYDIAKRLFAPVELLIKPISTTLYPEVLKRMVSKQDFFYTEFREIVHTLTSIAGIITICMFFLSYPIVTIVYGQENLRAAFILVFFSGICIAKFFLKPYHHIIHGLELQYIYPYLTVASSLIRISGYLLLIPIVILDIQIGAIAIPIVNTLTWFFPAGVVIWSKIRKKYNKTHIFETITKIFIPLFVVLFAGYQFNYHIYFFYFGLIAFIMMQIHLKIITKSKLTFIFQPILSVYNKLT